MFVCLFFFFQAEDGIRDLVRSRGLGDVYKRQDLGRLCGLRLAQDQVDPFGADVLRLERQVGDDGYLSLIHI